MIKAKTPSQKRITYRGKVYTRYLTHKTKAEADRYAAANRPAVVIDLGAGRAKRYALFTR